MIYLCKLHYKSFGFISINMNYYLVSQLVALSLSAEQIKKSESWDATGVKHVESKFTGHYVD